MRGNLHFARGDNAACRAAHQAALAFAGSLADPLWEVHATSGLGDADYADGRMVSALARFRRCVELCDAHGLTRAAVPNLGMVGYCRFFLLEIDEGIAELEAAHALAVEIGNRYAEMFTLEGQGSLLAFCNRYADALPLIERGLALAEAIGARRYRRRCSPSVPRPCSRWVARTRRARTVERALALFRETGMRFWGPMALALRARLQDDERERERDRAEAEALLAQGCASHNHIGYHRIGIEDALARGEWPRALAHAAALERYSAAEPLPYSDFLIARARVLVGLAARPADPALLAELARLRAEAARVRWPIDWPDPAGASG